MKTYAPVYIPTLNRYKHFKNCLESLEACIGAEHTDVFVGLDYPPSSKYQDGWKQIDDYLKEKESSHKFNSLMVFRRDTNCGICNEHSNGLQLQKYVSERYDRFIFSEDDNVFSKNFLLYMNQGLERYKDDPKCIGVCGYNYYGVNLDDYPSNIYLSREFSAWGVGYWTHKQKELSFLRTRKFAESIFSTWHNIFKIYKHEPRLLNTVLLNIASGKIFGDTMRVSYQYINDCYSVFPRVSKVRNQGFDNSGVTIFKNDDNYNHQLIDKTKDFQMDSIQSSVNSNVQKKVEIFFKRSFAMNMLILIRVLIYKLFKIDICYREMKKRNPGLFK